jgi:hypothetical protein
MTFEAPTSAMALYSSTPGTQASPEGQAPELHRPGPPLAPLLCLLRPLVSIPPPMPAITLARADVGVVTPLVEVPPVGVAAELVVILQPWAGSGP